MSIFLEFPILLETCEKLLILFEFFKLISIFDSSLREEFMSYGLSHSRACIRSFISLI